MSVQKARQRHEILLAIVHQQNFRFDSWLFSRSVAARKPEQVLANLLADNTQACSQRRLPFGIETSRHPPALDHGGPPVLDGFETVRAVGVRAG